MMEDLSFHVLDLAENAVNAGATRIIILINENAARDVLTIRVADNGRGIPADAAARAFDPFFTTQRKRTAWAWPCWPRPPASAVGTWPWPPGPAGGRGWRPVSAIATSTASP